MERIIHIDYTRCLKALLRMLPIALCVALAASIIGAISCYYLLDPYDEFTARSSVYTRTTNQYGNAAEGVQYAELAKSLTVAERALEMIGNHNVSKYDIYDMIEVQFDNSNVYVNSSAVINIYAASSDPQLSIDVANAVASAFVAESNYIVKEDTQMAVLDKAATTQLTYSVRKQFWMYTGISAAVGFVLVCIIAVLREMLSLRLVTIADGTLYGKLDIIGAIPDNADIQ